MQEGFVKSMNKQCAMYCIDLIRCLMQEKNIPPVPETISLEELCRWARNDFDDRYADEEAFW